ncbi:MAG TPA: PqqD family protein [Acidimicrobiia bacterium]|nr:PqqD family protein [Acidimicrobiia bacterium]
MTARTPAVRPHDIDERFVARRAGTAHTVEVDGEAVLLNDGRLHLLNATGTLVWACFDGEGTIAEIAADISDGLGVPYETVLDDTLAVARELGTEGLLAEVAPTEPEQDGDTAREGTLVVAQGTESKWASDPRFVDEPPNT